MLSPVTVFIFNLSLVCLLTPLHRSLPAPSEKACRGELLSQNKHITLDSISPGQLLRTNFLLIDLHPSLSFLSLLPDFSSIFSPSESSFLTFFLFTSLFAMPAMSYSISMFLSMSESPCLSRLSTFPLFFSQSLPFLPPSSFPSFSPLICF